MLIKIDPILSPKLLFTLRTMGHGDKLVLADANFPANSMNKNVIRLDGVNIEDAAKAIIGTKLDPDAMAALDAACQAACKPIDDKRGTIEYRTKIAGVLGRRAVTIAAERAGGK